MEPKEILNVYFVSDILMITVISEYIFVAGTVTNMVSDDGVLKRLMSTLDMPPIDINAIRSVHARNKVIKSSTSIILLVLQCICL